MDVSVYVGQVVDLRVAHNYLLGWVLDATADYDLLAIEEFEGQLYEALVGAFGPMNGGFIAASGSFTGQGVFSVRNNGSDYGQVVTIIREALRTVLDKFDSRSYKTQLFVK